MQEEMICGFHAVQAVIETEPESIAEIWLDSQREDRRMQQLVDAARQVHIRLQRVPRAKLDELVGAKLHHQGVIARRQQLRRWHERDLPDFLDALLQTPFLLVLDGVQDPHNLGACVRSAAAAGIQAVIIPKTKSAPVTATARSAASGAAERLPIFSVTNLARTLELLQERGIWTIGAAGEGETELYNIELTGALAVVMGSEGKGLRRLTRERCDRLVRIPMASGMESLNVSVATGVVLFEAVRQRAS